MDEVLTIMEGDGSLPANTNDFAGRSGASRHARHHQFTVLAAAWSPDDEADKDKDKGDDDDDKNDEAVRSSAFWGPAGNSASLPTAPRLQRRLRTNHHQHHAITDKMDATQALRDQVTLVLDNYLPGGKPLSTEENLADGTAEARSAKNPARVLERPFAISTSYCCAGRV
ncbi:Uu.00g140560.m01.CDS01 [Anthostomella pinea]|uniref:Uu.00g140560.m01.CDS01 n=1 Tax=Anthostomella pinea TaxID=933095 RepID=A0AAI8VQ65_9PEZI|nr:Uu.00g140560.m01.CDS01 [Anthostomella pinea]